MSTTPEHQLFPEPAHDAVVMAAWQRFLSGEAASSEELRGVVDLSWQRCLQGQVDPERDQAPSPLSDLSLQSLQYQARELLEASAPIMACARDFLAETGTVMALADTQCTILSMEGDTSTLGRAESIHLLPGATWEELICGTNAIGTAREIGKAVQIHSAEHFCAGIKRWTCSATVIRHPQDGEILGVIDVSGLSEAFSRHSLALVATSASRIESRIAMREMEWRYRLLEHAMQRMSRFGHDGVVLFDRRGCPIKANEHAEAAIGAHGGGMDLRAAQRVRALSIIEKASAVEVPALPAWIDENWLEPLVVDGDQLGTLLVMPLPRRRVRSADAPAESPADEPHAFGSIIGNDPGLGEAIELASQLAPAKIPILLLGETGVGKEEFARSIHASSKVADGPFVALNCGGLSRELLASELYGYADGAFTGARRGGRIGKIEAADGGTLFLDEIGELPVDLQPQLLRVLEQGEIQRLGENATRHVSFRLITATNRDLPQEVLENRFRMDFYYRIAVATIHIPSLRERRGDVRLLVEHFLKRFCREYEVNSCAPDEDLLARLEEYSWPGNVRELRNVVESMLLLARDRRLRVRDLPRDLSPAFAAAQAQPPLSSPQSLESAEREHIREIMRTKEGNMTSVARTLGIAKSTLYLKIHKHGLAGELKLARGNAGDV